MFIARGKEDALVTYNLVIGESVYGEKRISVEVLNGFFVCMLQFNAENAVYIAIPDVRKKSFYDDLLLSLNCI